MEDWLWNIVTITGANVDNAGNPYFWKTPIGFTVLLTITVCSLFAIFVKAARADMITTLHNWTLVGVCVIALMHIAENSNPKHQLQILLISLACKKAWDTYLVIKNKGR